MGCCQSAHLQVKPIELGMLHYRRKAQASLFPSHIGARIGTLHLTLVGLRDLGDHDFLTGGADPFCVLELGKGEAEAAPEGQHDSESERLPDTEREAEEPAGNPGTDAKQNVDVGKEAGEAAPNPEKKDKKKAVGEGKKFEKARKKKKRITTLATTDRSATRRNPYRFKSRTKRVTRGFFERFKKEGRESNMKTDFHENFIFDVYEGTPVLRVSVWDDDFKLKIAGIQFGRDDHIGTALVFLDSLADGEVVDRWYNLRTKSFQDSESDVRLRLCLTMDGAIRCVRCNQALAPREIHARVDADEFQQGRKHPARKFRNDAAWRSDLTEELSRSEHVLSRTVACPYPSRVVRSQK